MLPWLERRLGFLAVPNVTLFVICGQVLTFVVLATQPAVAAQIILLPEAVLRGEAWRLLTFIFMAPILDPSRALSGVGLLFFLIQLQLLWIFGRALEQYWGTLRYNLFLLVGYLANVGAAFLVYALWQSPLPATNGFLYGTVFLAFAFLFPDYVLHLFFVLPIRVKWLALITWLFYGFMALTGPWMVKLIVVASVANWIVFFWRDVLSRLRLSGRKVKRRALAAADLDEPFHRCVVCGRTDKTDPSLEFRYSRTDEGVKCFCSEHLPGAGGSLP